MTMLSKIMTGLSSLGLTIIPTTASAQSHMRPTSEARLSITVPFGVDRPTHKNKSRLELGVRNYAPSSLFGTHEWNLKSTHQPAYIDSAIGFTIDKTPDLMLNQQKIYQS